MNPPRGSVATGTGYNFDPTISRPTREEFNRRRLAAASYQSQFYNTDEVVEEIDSVNMENQAIAKLAEKEIQLWGISDVALFVCQTGAERYKTIFVNNMIDGRALLMINAEHLCSAMKMPLGTAVKFLYSIQKMKKIVHSFSEYNDKFVL